MDSNLSRRDLLCGAMLLPLGACIPTGEESVDTSALQPLPEEVLGRMIPDAGHLEDLGVIWTYFGADFAENKAFAKKLRASMEAAGLLLDTQGNQTQVRGRQSDIRLLAQAALDNTSRAGELPAGRWTCSVSEQAGCTAVYFRTENPKAEA